MASNRRCREDRHLASCEDRHWPHTAALNTHEPEAVRAAEGEAGHTPCNVSSCMKSLCVVRVGHRWLAIQSVISSLVFEASWALLGRSWRPLGALEAFWALLGRSWRPLGRSWDGLGGVLGTLGPELGASWELLGPSWERLESSWGRLGGILSALEAVLGTSGELLVAFCRSCEFHCFFNGHLDIFEVPKPVLEASWCSWRHLGPLEELLKHLGRVLSALGAS